MYAAWGMLGMTLIKKEKGMGRCQACQRDAATKRVVFYQNIGMLFRRKLVTIEGNFCRGCCSKYFFQQTGATLVTGWWGQISAFINPFLIVHNVVRYGFVMVTPWRGGPARGAGAAPVVMSRRPATPEGPIELEPEREEFPIRKKAAAPQAAAVRPVETVKKVGGTKTKEEMAAALKSYHADIRMRLKGGETPAAIAAFIAPRTGVPEGVVRQYVAKLAERG